MLPIFFPFEALRWLVFMKSRENRLWYLRIYFHFSLIFFPLSISITNKKQINFHLKDFSLIVFTVHHIWSQKYTLELQKNSLYLWNQFNTHMAFILIFKWFVFEYLTASSAQKWLPGGNLFNAIKSISEFSWTAS